MLGIVRGKVEVHLCGGVGYVRGGDCARESTRKPVGRNVYILSS